MIPALIESTSKLGGVARFKDHRKSYGLEFIDIRREIHAELKEIRPKNSPKGGKKKSLRTNLRYIAKDKSGVGTAIESSILIGGKNLKGSKSQRQVLAG